MTINHFISEYDLHDSLVTKIEYRDLQLVITIDFCYWMQNGYEDGEPETGIILLTFENVPDYNGMEGLVDDYSILDFIYKDGAVFISICDDFHDEVYQLEFDSDSVLMSAE